MRDWYISYGEVPVYDDDFFTKARAKQWKNYFTICYDEVRKKLKTKMDSTCMIEFFLDYSLLRESIIDAIIGMKKIVDSKNNKVEKPNYFKLASYLSYWWLRHKPVSIHYPKNFNLNKDVTTIDKDEEERKKLIWQLKHINEIVAVNFTLTFIFDFKNQIYSDKLCAKLKEDDNTNFVFESFDEMRKVMMDKLTYYFCYRAIAPKIIEHILEGYTFHPAWALTGPHWRINDEDEQ